MITLEHWKQAAKLVSDIVGAIASVKELLSRNDARDAAVHERVAEAGTKVKELEKVLLDLTKENTALVHACNRAEKKIVDLERQVAKAHKKIRRTRNWKRTRASYALKSFLNGTSAMVFDPAVTGSHEPVHNLCPSCFDELCPKVGDVVIRRRFEFV